MSLGWSLTFYISLFYAAQFIKKLDIGLDKNYDSVTFTHLPEGLIFLTILFLSYSFLIYLTIRKTLR